MRDNERYRERHNEKKAIETERESEINNDGLLKLNGWRKWK